MSLFQSRHYKAIAEVMKKSSNETNTYAIRKAVDNLVVMFKADNPNFKELMFIEDCGYDGRKKGEFEL